MKNENFGVQAFLEDALCMEGVDEGFLGGALGKEDAVGLGVRGFGGEEKDRDYSNYSHCSYYYSQYDFCSFLHNFSAGWKPALHIFCILIESTYLSLTKSQSLKWPHSV